MLLARVMGGTGTHDRPARECDRRPLSAALTGVQQVEDALPVLRLVCWQVLSGPGVLTASLILVAGPLLPAWRKTGTRLSCLRRAVGTQHS
jgi:hypothetical protein